MHTIRLRRPWTRICDGQSSPDKVDVPDDSPLLVNKGTLVTYRRSFNQPTGLTSDDRVWLSVDHYTAGSIDVIVNETSVYRSDVDQTLRLDVTMRLQPANRLTIRLTGDHQGRARLGGEVTLQIEPSIR